MIDEGYIKYQQHFKKDEPLPIEEIDELNHFRNKLFKMGLIGAYSDGIGFGNISALYKGKMIISGTQTGQNTMLNENHFTVITSYSIERNELWCEGPIKASSESLTHAAVYELNDEIEAVIHIHSKKLWEKHLQEMPTTAPHITYGTPEMAMEVKRLYHQGRMDKIPVMIMAGHEEGIITFGKNLQEAFSWIEKL